MVFQVGSGEVFSIDDPITNDDEFEEEDDDWQDLVIQLWRHRLSVTLDPSGRLNNGQAVFVQTLYENAKSYPKIVIIVSG